MKRQIDTTDLQIGMYVSELDIPWLESPFLFQGFKITSQGDINELMQCCKYVFIDEEQSDYERVESLAKQQDQVASSSKLDNKPGRPIQQKPIEEEIAAARKVREVAETQLSNMFSQASLGQALNVEQAQQVVSDVIASLVRNPDAMVLLGSIRSHAQEAESHAINTSILSITLGRFLKYSPSILEELGLAALMHDVGEVKIPAELLRRIKKTPEEAALVKKHVEFGVNILRDTAGIPDTVIDTAYSHHEQVDGKGYPRGLQDEEISPFAKIIAIVDAYDKLTRGRKEQSLSTADALRYLYTYRDKFFDATLTERFIQCLGIYPVGSLVEVATGEIGIVISIPPGDHLHPRLLLVRSSDKKSYEPPQVINLALFAQNDAKKYAIKQVLPPNAYGIDMRSYILNESIF